MNGGFRIRESRLGFIRRMISNEKRARVQENLILDCFRKNNAVPTY